MPTSLAQLYGQGEDRVPNTRKQVSFSGNAAKSLAARISSGTFGSNSKHQPSANNCAPSSNELLSRNIYNRAFASNSRTVSAQASNNRQEKEKTRTERMREACIVNGFKNAGIEDDLSQVVTVQASDEFMRRGASSIGAHPTTSLRADPGRLTVASPSSTEGTPFELFFGEGKFGFKSRWDAGNQDVWSLPQAFTGESQRLSQTIEQLIFLDGNWYTDVVSPIEVTNAMSIQWSRWEFSPHLTDVVPELGVNRLVQSSRQQNSARFVRRAIGFMLEHGFMNTPIGITHYLMNINQLVQAAIETNKFDVIHTLLTCHDENKRWVLEQGLFSGKAAEDVYRRGELFFWDIIKKQKNGVEKLDTQVSQNMAQWRGEADTWIFHPEVRDYLTQVPAEKTDFLIAGAAGPQRLADGPSSMVVFRNNRIFTTRAFHVDENGAVDIMSFPTQIGEYHIASDRTGSMIDDPSFIYSSSLRDISVFDEDRDKFTVITPMDMVNNCNRFDESGAIIEWDEADVMTKFSNEQKANDPLHYVASDQSIQRVQFYANIKSAHMSADSRLLLGKTVKRHMKGVPGWQRADELLNSARQAVAEMESYDYADAKEYIDAVINGQDAPQSSANRAEGMSNPPVFDLREYPVNGASGSMVLPTTIPAAATAAIGLPPGFQSYEGIKEVVRVSKLNPNAQGVGEALQAGGSLVNVEQSTVDDLEAFIKFFDQVVRRLQRIFSGSLLLDRNSASSWWQRPSAQGVLFNVAVHKYRVPLWSTGGATGSTNAAGVTNQLSNAAIGALEQISQPLIERANRVLGSVDGGTVAAPAAPISQGLRNFLGYVQFTGTANAAADPANPTAPLVIQGGLTTDNYGTFVEALFTYHIVLHLIGSLPRREVTAAADSAAGSPERTALLAKLTKIEDKVINQYAPSFARFVRGIGENADKFGADISKLGAKPAKGKKSFLDEQSNGDALSARFGELYKEIQGVGTLEGDASLPHGVQGGDVARTTLLAAPRLIQGIASAVARSADLTDISFVPSSLSLPDVIMERSELETFTDIGAQSSNNRPAALIEETLLGSGAATTTGVENIEFVQVASAYDTAGKLGDGDLQSFAANMSSFSSARGNQYASPTSVGGISAGSAYDDVEMEFLGDELEPIGDASLPSYAAGKRASSITDAAMGLGGVGALRPSRRGLPQGIADFVRARDALLSNSSRRNFLELAAAENDNWAYVFASVFNYTPVSLQTLKRFISANITLPFNFLLVRPHAEYEATAAIKMKAGRDTITTYQRRGEFMVGDDVNIGAHTGHYRYYSKVICKNPKNVSVSRAVYIRGYNGRMGTRFFDKQSYRPSRNEYGNGSLFSFLIGYEETDNNTPDVINVSGSLNNMQLEYELAHEDKLHYSSAPYYNWFWGFSVGKSLEIDGSHFQFANQQIGANQNALHGTTKFRNLRTRDFVDVNSGRGHWGDSATLGTDVAAARRGQMTTFKPLGTTAVTFI